MDGLAWKVVWRVWLGSWLDYLVFGKLSGLFGLESLLDGFVWKARCTKVRSGLEPQVNSLVLKVSFWF